jgi:hypothetical protein
MSRYAVIVAGKNVDEQLAPFNERLEVRPYFFEADEWTYTHAKEYLGLLDKEELTQKELEQIAAITSKEMEATFIAKNGKIWVETTRNPESKWDWYSVGGRFEGFFTLKKDGKQVNSAMKSEIDFESGHEATRRRAERLFLGWEEQVKKGEVPEYMVKFIDRVLGDRDKDSVEDRKASYINNCVKWEGVTVALLVDGTWYERGSVGAFGTLAESMSDEEWCQKFYEILDSLPPDTQLTIVDCHI